MAMRWRRIACAGFFFFCVGESVWVHKRVHDAEHGVLHRAGGIEMPTVAY